MTWQSSMPPSPKTKCTKWFLTNISPAYLSELPNVSLSELPNDVLLNILERMDTLDALRACLVSKQMQKLPTMLS
jgi:hypothetical protein